jgi:hypothetical protein
LFGVTPTGGRPPLTLWERPFEFDDGARLDCFLSGDSGLGSDGLLGLNIGLAGLAPGPTDCENLAGRAGVGGVNPFLVLLPFIVLYDGVEGVPGYESVAPEGERLSARWTGKKMPAPAMVVLKYFILQRVRQHQIESDFCIPNIPFDVAIILSLCRKLPIQLNTHKASRLSPYTSEKAHRPVHLSRDIDRVTDFQVDAHDVGSDRHGTSQSVQRRLAVLFGGRAGA